MFKDFIQFSRIFAGLWWVSQSWNKVKQTTVVTVKIPSTHTAISMHSSEYMQYSSHEHLIWAWTCLGCDKQILPLDHAVPDFVGHGLTYGRLVLVDQGAVQTPIPTVNGALHGFFYLVVTSLVKDLHSLMNKNIYIKLIMVTYFSVSDSFVPPPLQNTHVVKTFTHTYSHITNKKS